MCFSMEWLRDILIWVVVVCAVIAVIQLLIPRILPVGEPFALIYQILRIVMWAAIVIFIIVVAFDLLSCLAFPGLLPRR